MAVFKFALRRGMGLHRLRDPAVTCPALRLWVGTTHRRLKHIIPYCNSRASQTEEACQAEKCYEPLLMSMTRSMVGGKSGSRQSRLGNHKLTLELGYHSTYPGAARLSFRVR